MTFDTDHNVVVSKEMADLRSPSQTGLRSGPRPGFQPLLTASSEDWLSGDYNMDLKHEWEVLVDEEIEQMIPDGTNSKDESLRTWGHAGIVRSPAAC